MTLYDSIDEDVLNVLEHALLAEADMAWALANPEQAKLTENQKMIFRHNLPIFTEINAKLMALKG